jgi:hypothetical protein
MVRANAIFNCGVSTMRHASFPTNIDSSTPTTSNRTTRGFFAVLIEALHQSRQLQAQRVLRQYSHLIAQPDAVDIKSNAGGQQNVDH